jgi:hypothetical protein
MGGRNSNRNDDLQIAVISVRRNEAGGNTCGGAAAGSEKSQIDQRPIYPRGKRVSLFFFGLGGQKVAIFC